MTDPEFADATYIEPITPEMVAKIIEKEKPDALLPTMGGQTALNTALSLAKMGVLDAHGVEMIGAKRDAIDKAEDRELFQEAMTKIGWNRRAAVSPGQWTKRSKFSEEDRPARDHPPVLHDGRHRRRRRL